MDQSRRRGRTTSPKGTSANVYEGQFRCSGCHGLIHPNALVLLDSLLPAEIEPEEGFEPSTFRLRGDRKSERPNRLGKVAQVSEGAWQSRASQRKAEHRPSHRPEWSTGRYDPVAGPILTMDRRPSAVLAGILAGRSAPWMPQLCAQIRCRGGTRLREKAARPGPQTPAAPS
jgi:hypothetical protein